MLNSEDAETSDYIADKLQETRERDNEQKISSSAARGTQTTASLRARNKAANKKAGDNKLTNRKKGAKDKDNEGELWKMSKFTKHAKPVISTRHCNNN